MARSKAKQTLLVHCTMTQQRVLAGFRVGGEGGVRMINIYEEEKKQSKARCN